MKQNKMKLKMSKISSHNVSQKFYNNIKIQKNISSNKKFIHSTTLNNTNNNSISSINGNKNHYPTSKNNLFNAKMTK